MIEVVWSALVMVEVVWSALVMVDVDVSDS